MRWIVLLVVSVIYFGCSGKRPGEAEFPQAPALSIHPGDKVVLLHGLWRNSRAMERFAQYLKLQGLEPVNLSYPSTRLSIHEISDQVLAPALKACCLEAEQRVHFVTHSMGGIVLRDYLNRYTLPSLGRVVMWSPPNQGTEVVEFLHDNPLLPLFAGPAGRSLGTSPESLPNQLGPVNFELGVITGDQSTNLFTRMLIPGPNDGMVAVERAKVLGMQDFLVVKSNHVWIRYQPEVWQQTLHFLEHGRFAKITSWNPSFPALTQPSSAHGG